MITRKKIRTMRPTARALARLCNDLERTTRRLRRLLEEVGTQEAQVALYQAHLDKLRKKYTPPTTPDV